MEVQKVRVRFAPSPTGPLHMGGVRTALYNYLFAKANQGQFVLRIEDTDQNRYVSGAEEYIIEALKWCGIPADEGAGFGGGKYGPYRQSERKEIYPQYVEKLLESGHAYYAFDTPEELEEMRERLKKAKVQSPQYNAATRGTMKNSLTLSSDEVKARLKRKDPHVVRIKVPRNEEIRFYDEIRGWVVVHTANMDDKVLYKSDGMPTYHLANVVDDHLMKITHVIRGEEWLPSAPLHALLYRCLGWEEQMPKFAHLPLILRPDGNGKLSKRDGDRLGFPVFPLQWKDPGTGETSSGYREEGYFSQAFINTLVLLGWNPGTNQEVFTLEGLIGAFTLSRVGKSGAKFDPEKAKWFNQQYLKNMPDEELAQQLTPLLKKEKIKSGTDYIAQVCRLMKERAIFISDLLEGKYFFVPPQEYEKKVIKKKWKETSAETMQKLSEELEAIEDFSAEQVERSFKAFIEQEELPLGAVLPIFRLLVTGSGSGPSMFEIAALLGKRETVDRIKVGINQSKTWELSGSGE